MSWKTIKLWNLHKVSCNEHKRKSLKNSNPPLCKVVYRSKLRLPLLCLRTPVRMQCTWYCIGLHAVRILWRLCRYAEGSVTLMPRCRNEQKTIDNRNRISENDFNCKPALENYQISIKAEFTFSAHFVFGVFILFSLKAFQADIQYRLNAPSLSLSPPNTKNHSQLLLLFHFFSLGDLPSVKSKTEASRKWRKSGDEEDSWADIWLFCYAMRFPCRGVNCANRKINVFRINFSSWTTNTLAASPS